MKVEFFRTPRLALAAASAEMLLAVSIHVFPALFYVPTHGYLESLYPVDAALMVGGMLLVLTAWYALPPWVRFTLSLLAAGPLVILAGGSWAAAHWIGVTLFSLGAAAILAAAGLNPGPEASANASRAENGQPDPFPFQLESILHAWSWALVVTVAAVRALGDWAGVGSHFTGDVFVLAATVHNVAAHWVLPRFAAREKRLVYHMAFLTVAVGFLAAGISSIGPGLLALVGAIPPLAARALGQAAGYRILALALTTVTLSELWGWLLSGRSIVVVGQAVANILVLAMAATIGVRMGGEQYLLVRNLAGARRDLKRKVDQLRLLDRIGSAVRRSLDLDEVLRATVQELGVALAASRCFIRLRLGDELLPVSHEYYAPGVAPIGLGDMTRLPVVSLAIQSQQAVIVEDVATDSRLDDLALGRREDLLALGARSVIATSILSGKELLGAIALHQHGAPRQWTPQEAEFLEAVADQVAVAMVHARTHHALSERHAELQQAHQDLQTQTEALRDSEERFRSAFGYAAIGMALVGTDGRWLQVNRTLCEMLGYAQQELLATTAATITDPDDVENTQFHMGHVLDHTINTFQLEKRYRHSLGHVVWVQENVSLVRDAHGTPLYFIVQMQDITEWKGFEAQLFHAANHDPLTDLFNRRRFQDELERRIREARRYGGRWAVLFLDLDQFKYVNDSLGHQAGDELLKDLASLLRQRVRRTDIPARLGGDEFAVILLNADSGQAQAIAQQILEAIRQHVTVVNGQAISVTASIGVALFPDHGTTAEELVTHADLAMYQAKENGRNAVSLYRPDQGGRALIESRRTWEQRIREALEKDRFLLYCQPILDLCSNRISQYELLLRMAGDEGEVISPTAFLEVAERFGLIHAIDRYVVRQAIHLIALHQQAGRTLCLEVNLSGKAFADDELLPMIQRELSQTGINPACLVLEITETAAIADTSQARKFIETLKGMGCRFAVDDFGAGFSSFAYLKHLPVDYLKIDGSFIRNLSQDSTDQHLVKAMVEVARGLGKKTIAEFVGDEETVQLLRQYGVDYAQGYHIGCPGPMAEIVKFRESLPKLA